jgi:hypothetical protein
MCVSGASSEALGASGERCRRIRSLACGAHVRDQASPVALGAVEPQSDFDVGACSAPCSMLNGAHAVPGRASVHAPDGNRVRRSCLCGARFGTAWRETAMSP